MEIPLGTTHFIPGDGPHYLKQDGESWKVWVPSLGGWLGTFLIDQTSLLKLTDLRPAPEWTGKNGSLPPLGLTVEAWFPKDTVPAWLPTKLVYVSKQNVIYSYGEGMREVCCNRKDFENLDVKFRPIRTAEQLAAEEREADAESLFQVIHPDGKWHKADGLYKERFRCAIDAGYRK